jgi:hypothetical protein
VGQWRVSKFDKNKPSKIDFPKGEAGSGTAFLYLSLLSVTRGVTMPSYFLPIFPAGATVINDRLTFENKDGFITYFNFLTPIHRHHEKDTKHFRMIISDFCHKSKRNQEDSAAPMGMGATNTVGRILSSISRAGSAVPEFQQSVDIVSGGVMLAVPALLHCGLLNHIDKYFKLPDGYYDVSAILLTLAFSALARISSIEQLRYEPPGEWGKLLGLDRIPEVKTLREKIAMLANVIVPSLETTVPNQPSQEQLEKNSYMSRFTLVFDREGYSPHFMAR